MKKIKASRKCKLFAQSIKKNFSFNRSTVTNLLILAYTSFFLYSHTPYVLNLFDYLKYGITNYVEAKNFDVEEYKESLNETITCMDMEVEVESGYELMGGDLYQKNGEKVDLTDEVKPLILAKCGISNNTLKEMNLNKSNIEYIYFDYIAITDDFIENLPRDLKGLCIARCDYITNLDNLHLFCPNLEELSIERITSLTSFDFINNLSNLKTLNVTDTYGITNEFLECCKEKGINIISNGNEVKNTEEIKTIARELINDDMTDEEKIKSICKYVVDRISYDLDLSTESNLAPISCALNNEGVCISYAYLTSALLKEANITSYRVNSKNHVWNLVEIKGEYYYIDNTGTDAIWLMQELFELFGISPCYMGDPNQNTLLSSINVDEDFINIPPELKRDILAKEHEKSFIEKYGPTAGVFGIAISEIAAYALFWYGVLASYEIIYDFCLDVAITKDTYKKLKLEEVNKNKH